MTLQQYMKKTKWDDVEHIIRQHLPRNEAYFQYILDNEQDSYEKMISFQSLPKKVPYTITIAKHEEIQDKYNYSIYAVGLDGKKKPIDTWSWDYVLGAELSDASVSLYGKEVCIVLCLMEMTKHGFFENHDIYALYALEEKLMYDAKLYPLLTIQPKYPVRYAMKRQNIKLACSIYNGNMLAFEAITHWQEIMRILVGEGDIRDEISLRETNLLCKDGVDIAFLGSIVSKIKAGKTGADLSVSRAIQRQPHIKQGVWL